MKLNVGLKEFKKTYNQKRNQVLYYKIKSKNSLEIEIESVRDKSSVGKHEVIFTIKNEEYLVSHNALSRDIFGEGINLALSLKDKNPGIYSMADLLKG